MSESPGLVHVDVVVIEGSDATTLIDSQLSQAVGSLALGESRWSLLLEPDGHFGDWVRVVRADDERWLVLGASGRSEAVAERLGRFKLREKAVISIDAWAVRVAPAGSDHEGLVLPALWAEPGEVEVLTSVAAEFMPVSAHAVREQLRLDRGQLSPDDLEPGDNPFAIGADNLAAAVSFTKGCYTGQELVARMDSRSASAPRRLVVADASVPLPEGSALWKDGQQVGSVRTNRGGRRSICIVNRSVVVPSSDEVTCDDVAVTLSLATGSG